MTLFELRRAVIRALANCSHSGPDRRDAMMGQLWDDDDLFEKTILVMAQTANGSLPSDPLLRLPITLARRFIIGRDFNVFDCKQADMLWKLQQQ